MNRKQIAADLLDAPRDAIAMKRTHAFQCLQDTQRQRSLVHFLVAHAISYLIPIGCHCSYGKAIEKTRDGRLGREVSKRERDPEASWVATQPSSIRRAGHGLSTKCGLALPNGG